MMEYKNYIGHVEYDDESEIFHGEVINVSHVITFQGSTPKELKQAFRDSVDVYLDYCEVKGIEPAKPYSGNLTLRIKPELHQSLAIKAKLAHKSLNSFIAEHLAVVC